MKILSHPLVVICGPVIASSVVVLGLLSNEAAALAHTALAARHESARVQPEQPWDFWTPELENLARELTEAKAALASRETALSSREQRLADEAAELDDVRRRIERLRTELDARLVEVQGNEVRNLKSLAATYSGLTPAAAMVVFGEMDDLTVAKLLSLMKPDVTRAIIEEYSRNPGPENANVKRIAAITDRLRLLMPTPPDR